jgi:hypothetical protein
MIQLAAWFPYIIISSTLPELHTKKLGFKSDPLMKQEI